MYTVGSHLSKSQLSKLHLSNPPIFLNILLCIKWKVFHFVSKHLNTTWFQHIRFPVVVCKQGFF